MSHASDRLPFSDVVEQHHESVYRFALKMTGGDPVAEDILQETFVSAMRAYEGFRGDGSVKSWLFSIARRELIRSTRRRVGEPRAYEPLDDLQQLGLEAGWGDEDTPERLAMRAEDHRRLRDALDALSADDREVLLLRDVEGLTGPEAAEVLDVGLRALKSRLHRARLRLAAELRKEVTDGD